MAFNGYREKALQDRQIVADGEKPRQIAAELGCTYGTLRRRLSRHVQAIGCTTPEQAVAVHVAEKIRAVLPLALQRHVDLAIKRQRGFIFGGMYAYLAMALAASTLAIGMYALGRSEGRKLERAEWAEQQNADLRTANQALGAAHKKVREQEARAAQKVAAISTAYQKDLANANRAKTLAMDALRAGAIVLRDPGATDPAADRACQVAASPGGRDGGASPRLSEPLAQFLTSLASEADSVVIQLAACQSVVRADRDGQVP